MPNRSTAAMRAAIQSPVRRPAVAGYLLPNNAPIIINGNSKNAAGTSVGPDYSRLAIALSGGRFYQSPWARQSVAGDRVDQYQARMAKLVPILRHGGNIGGLMVAGDATNSLANSAYAGQTPAAILAQYRDMAEQVTDINSATGALGKSTMGGSIKNCFLIELTPQYPLLTTQGALDCDTLNAAIIAMCAEPNWQGRVSYSDQRPLGQYLTGYPNTYTTDGKHYYYWKLARIAANILANKLATYHDQSVAMVPTSGNAPTNPGFGANIMVNSDLADVSTVDGKADSFTFAVGSGASIAYANSGGVQSLTTSNSATTNSGADTMANNAVPTPASRPGRVYESFVKVDAAGTSLFGISMIGTNDASGSPGFSTPATAGAIGSFSGAVFRSSAAPIVPTNNNNTYAFAGTGISKREVVGTADTVLTVSKRWFLRECEVTAYCAPYSMAGSIPLYTAMAIINASGVLRLSQNEPVAGGGFFDTANGGSIVYQWQQSDGSGGWNPVGTDDRTLTTGTTGNSYRLRAIYTSALGTATFYSNTITL